MLCRRHDRPRDYFQKNSEIGETDHRDHVCAVDCYISICFLGFCACLSVRGSAYLPGVYLRRDCTGYGARSRSFYRKRVSYGRPRYQNAHSLSGD